MVFSLEERQEAERSQRMVNIHLVGATCLPPHMRLGCTTNMIWACQLIDQLDVQGLTRQLTSFQENKATSLSRAQSWIVGRIHRFQTAKEANLPTRLLKSWQMTMKFGLKVLSE